MCVAYFTACVCVCVGIVYVSGNLCACLILAMLVGFMHACLSVLECVPACVCMCFAHVHECTVLKTNGTLNDNWLMVMLYIGVHYCRVYFFAL